MRPFGRAVFYVAVERPLPGVGNFWGGTRLHSRVSSHLASRFRAHGRICGCACNIVCGSLGRLPRRLSLCPTIFSPYVCMWTCVCVRALRDSKTPKGRERGGGGETTIVTAQRTSTVPTNSDEIRRVIQIIFIVDELNTRGIHSVSYYDVL